jgi:hypothetical protein
MKTASDKIELLYMQAETIASMEVEKMARKILREHKGIREFVMCMGHYSFTDKNGKTIVPLLSRIGMMLLKLQENQ